LARGVSSLNSYHAAAPLLLVTAFAPGATGGGAVILRSLLKGSESCVVWASLEVDGSGYSGPTDRLQRKRNPWLEPPSRLARRIDALADRHSASAVWAVAHGPVVPCLSAFAGTSWRGLHLSVHDDPAWSVAFRGRRQLIVTPWLHRQFGRALRDATSIDAIGGGMRASIAVRAGRDSIVVHRVLDDAIAPNEVPQDPETLTIGLLGSVYASSQLEQLSAMLAETAATLRVRTRLAIIGRATPDARAAVRRSKVDVDFLGHMAENDAIAVLRGAFALYLGYPFSCRERVLRRTSFPAKLATYVQAARPLLIHTPYDSSLTPLFGFHPFTIPWVDENIYHGSRQLASAWRSPPLRASQHTIAEAVRETYFSASNRERLFASLNELVRA